MIHVRAWADGDIEMIVEFQLCLARETEDLDRASVTQGVRAVVADAAKGRYWLAEEDGRHYEMFEWLA